MLQRVAVDMSMHTSPLEVLLQCAAACCSVLQRVAVCGGGSQCVAINMSLLPLLRVSVSCSGLQCLAVNMSFQVPLKVLRANVGE